MTALSQQRARRRLLLLVLPALLLRALIPVGFMPIAGPAGPTLGLCPGAVQQGRAHAGHAAHGASHTHHHDGADTGSAHHAPCLFSPGASAGLAALPVAGALDHSMLEAPSLNSSAPPFIPAILRTQSPRGPPHLI